MDYSIYQGPSIIGTNHLLKWRSLVRKLSSKARIGTLLLAELFFA
jgi:hypothetical protein